MKHIVVLILMLNLLFSAKTLHKEWKPGETLEHYLETHHIPPTLLASISKEDQKFISQSHTNNHYFELLDVNETLIQALIPISSEMQIHIYKSKTNNKYGFNVIPIEYKKAKYFAKVKIKESIRHDVEQAVHHPEIATKIDTLINRLLHTKGFKSGYEVDFIYTQKTRLGEPYDEATISIARVKARELEKYIYVDQEGVGHTSANKSEPYIIYGKKKVTYTKKSKKNSSKSTFGMPLRHIRITSSFSYSRWHPIQHRYKPHHGTDFGAKSGTPLLAVNSGKVSYSGWMNGYGKVVKIRHSGGYESLYAHQSRIRVKLGERVRKGQIIGYVGSTGRSTGPHLHFGLMKKGRWIDPMKVINKKSVSGASSQKYTKYKDTKTVKYKKVIIDNAQDNKIKLQQYIAMDKETYVW